jgi:hypothetical protein
MSARTLGELRAQLAVLDHLPDDTPLWLSAEVRLPGPGWYAVSFQEGVAVAEATQQLPRRPRRTIVALSLGRNHGDGGRP